MSHHGSLIALAIPNLCFEYQPYVGIASDAPNNTKVRTKPDKMAD